MYDLIQIRENFFCASFSGKSWPTSSNIYIIQDSDGLSLIDAGMDNPACFSALSACLQTLDRRVEDIHTILLTHGHPDHIGGANAICRQTAPRILIPEACIPEAIDPSQQDHYCLPPKTRSIAPAMSNFSILDNFNRTCGSWLLDRHRLTAFGEGATIRLGPYSFCAIQTPGHDIGLTVFYEPNLKCIFTGDLLKAEGAGSALPWYTSTAGGVDAYLESLERIESLDVEGTFPAHGILTGSFRDMVQQTKAAILEREAAILSFLAQSPKSCEQLDALLYRSILLKLCPWFSTVTEAHLSRLEAGGIVQRDGLDYFLSMNSGVRIPALTCS